MPTNEVISKRPESVVMRLLFWLYAVALDFIVSLPHVGRYLFRTRPSDDSGDVLKRGLVLIGLLIFFGFGMYGYVTALARHQGDILLLTIIGWSVIALVFFGARRYREIVKESKD